MLLKVESEKLTALINDSLNKAEILWAQGGHQLQENRNVSLESISKSVEPSKIPGHEFVAEGEAIIDEFVAFVADMRDSSRHLLCAMSTKNAKVSQLQRVFYETSALLPTIGYLVSKENGRVTEYLGDGALALFKIDQNDKSAAIYSAHRAAKSLVSEARVLINNVLKERYLLPEIDIGVGLALSKALITLVGQAPDMHPKAFGECVFRATKLSAGRNEVITDENLKAVWPTAKGGTLQFRLKRINDIDGYVI